MTCTAIAVGPYLRQPSLLQPHRLPLQHLTFVLLVIALLLTPGLANARALKQAIPSDATPSETFEASPQPTLSAAALQANPAFSLTLDSYYSRGLKHSRGLKQTSCPPSGSASSQCQSVGQGQVDSWRNTLVSQCSTVTPVASGSGACCSALPSPGSASWTSFVSCACSTLSAEVSAFVEVPMVLSTCGSSSSSGSSYNGFSTSPSASPRNPESSGSLFSPFSSSTPPTPPNDPSSSPASSSTSSSPPSPVNLPSPQPSGSPSYPSAPLESGSNDGGNSESNLASFQSALNGRAPPDGNSGTGQNEPASNINGNGGPSFGSGTSTPSNAGNDVGSFVPAVNNYIG